MSKEKACKICNRIHREDVCPSCGSKEQNDNFKGRIVILDPEKSEIATNIGLKQKGEFALKSR